MSGTITLPVVMTIDGLAPQAPADLRAQIVTIAQGLSPGLTANLPGSLIEDVTSTETAAVIVADQARVDLVNSLTPRGSNAWLLNQLGQMAGIPIGLETNTSCFVVFNGTPGFVIAQGFIVSDGTHQYQIVDGGILQSDGNSQPLLAIGTVQGQWAVPSGTVNQQITSVPSGFPITFFNPLDGIPSSASETEEQYRARVMQAGQAMSTGTIAYLKTLLGAIPGVQQRLISVRNPVGSGTWEVICGGSGDPFAVAYAIFKALFDIPTLAGSSMTVSGITNANPAVITTDLNHGYTTGQVVQMNGATGLTVLNGSNQVATVLSQTTFSVPVNTTSSGTYTGNGVMTPNFRNQLVSVTDYPDVYAIPYVTPPLQNVSMTITWGTNSPNLVNAASIASAAQPAISNYINGISVGQPINQFEMIAVFQAATQSLLDNNLLTRLVFAVAINGTGVSPDSGTGIIEGDPESFFSTTPSAITVNQG